MTQPRTHHETAPAFTLTELMVAVAITSALILVINQIFATVTDAISTGTATSEVLANSRIIGAQIEEDFDQMVGPTEGGFLVIVNKRYGGVHVLPEDKEAGYTRNLRSDQLVFIRRRAGDQPIAPARANSFDGEATGTYMKIWLGHVLRTAPDGTGSGDLGTANGPNEFADDWILGRQAVFLDPAIASGAANADGAFSEAPATNLGSSFNRLYQGHIQNADCALWDDGNEIATVGTIKPSSPDGTRHQYTLWTDVQTGEYTLNALQYTYAKTNQRLWCNPTPQGPSYASWEIGQMHSYLAGHVSEVIVEFAGDYDNDGDLDTNGAGASKEIEWYGLNTGKPSGIEAAGSNDTRKPIFVSNPAAVGFTGADRAWIFRHGPGATNWPSFVRIRYRLMDSRAKIAGPDGEPGRWFEQILRVKRD